MNGLTDGVMPSLTEVTPVNAELMVDVSEIPKGLRPGERPFWTMTSSIADPQEGERQRQETQNEQANEPETPRQLGKRSRNPVSLSPCLRAASGCVLPLQP